MGDLEQQLRELAGLIAEQMKVAPRTTAEWFLPYLRSVAELEREGCAVLVESMFPYSDNLSKETVAGFIRARGDTGGLIPAAACPRCGGWTGFGGMSQYSESSTPILGRTGCTCRDLKRGGK